MTAQIEWLTTKPNPRVKPSGYDAGQRGWKLHAVRDGQAMCGLRPGHGWGLDLFIDEPCLRCVAAAQAQGVEVPEEMVRSAVRRIDIRRRLRAGQYDYASPRAVRE